MKTKVIAFRVTEEEYEAICWAAAKDKVKIGEYVRQDFATTLGYTIEAMKDEIAKLEAKAKRAAKAAAKKAAANGNA